MARTRLRPKPTFIHRGDGIDGLIEGARAALDKEGMEKQLTEMNERLALAKSDRERADIVADYTQWGIE